VRPRIEVQERRTVLPPDLFQKYSELSFWRDGTGSAANVIRGKI
jgi:sulfotransferase